MKYNRSIMSKLPNAPLVEVIFEVRWAINDAQEVEVHQYLHGDLFNAIKDTYPYRESLLPHNIPLEMVIGVPSHRFRANPDKYPLIQVGVGLLTVNTTDDYYDWETYQTTCVSATRQLLEVFEPIQQKEYITLTLQYQDFIAVDFSEHNIYQYLEEYLHIQLKQNFFETTENPSAINISFHYKTSKGILEVSLKHAIHNQQQKEGLLITFNMTQNKTTPSIDSIKQWLEEAHHITANAFKKMTEGKLFSIFQQKK